MKENRDTTLGSKLLNKVPEITIYFWIIKVLCTTVGETFADYLNTTLNFGLTGTTIVMGIIFVLSLMLQFRVKKYVPWIYWLTVVLISVFGTLITDNLTDNLGVSLITTTTVFSIILAIIFVVWYKVEHTLSIHSITSFRREAFYWLAILFTFALGTAAGDLTAEQFNLGYLTAVGVFAGLLAVISILWRLRINAVFTFWIAYILTRPLGASIGDYLSQSNDDGGLGFGTVITSFVFLATILITILYLMFTKRDEIKYSKLNA
ncbi:MAG: COG4705 family protein [Candidatus Levyibacteriota bacterium]